MKHAEPRDPAMAQNRPVAAGDHVYRRARLRQGVSESLFGDLR